MALGSEKKRLKKEMFEGLCNSQVTENTVDIHSLLMKILEKFYSCNLIIANRIMIHKSKSSQVNAEYVKQLLDAYNAQVTEANFETETKSVVGQFNEWVNKKTNGCLENSV
ncbi:hypothetical protein B4U80_14136 [Leptotrombidium deliense]|uniref:Serpin domain-containing protein n=1 Tax=Leptotrombidium deliense TaxID=299467 RepID=A0A443S1Z9_9ACAR|nr:hypothetical protein B4U80_14136 [Leptotrombidium deliense]